MKRGRKVKNNDKRKVVLYGYGVFCRERLWMLSSMYDIQAIIDQNQELWGTSDENYHYSIINLDTYEEYYKEFRIVVVVGERIREEIALLLQNKGYQYFLFPGGTILIKVTDEEGRQYMLLHSHAPQVGILCAWKHFVPAAMWAEKQGTMPIFHFDFKPPYNISSLGENLWDRYFVNPNLEQIGIQQENLYKETNQFEPADYYLMKNNLVIRTEYNEENLHYYREVKHFAEKYIRLREDKHRQYEKVLNEVLPDREKTLAVTIREPNQILDKACPKLSKHHPKSPTTDLVIQKVSELMQEWGCEYIFVSTEFNTTINRFKEVFGDKVCYIQRGRIAFDENYFNMFRDTCQAGEDEDASQRIHEQYGGTAIRPSNMDNMNSYLTEVYIMSKCSYLLAAKSGGSLGAIYWNGGKYKNYYFFEDPNESKFY